jgi:hypothetical protein
MEIFVDGGLFELLIALSLGYLINVIYLKKYLLLLFSCVSIGAPIGLLFLHKGGAFYLLAAISTVNAILLVVLLWRQRAGNPDKPLFNLDNWKRPWLSKNASKPSLKP